MRVISDAMRFIIPQLAPIVVAALAAFPGPAGAQDALDGERDRALDDAAPDVDESEGAASAPTIGRITARLGIGYTARLGGNTPTLVSLLPPCVDGGGDSTQGAAPATCIAAEGAEDIAKFLEDDVVEVNPFGPVISARLGYTLETQFYLGIVAQLHIGEQRTVTTRVGNASAKASGKASSIEVGVELGLDAAFGPVVLRPVFGAGVTILNTENCIPGELAADGDGSARKLCVDDSDQQLYYAPGIDMLWFVSDPIFVAVGTRLVGVTGSTASVGATASLSVGTAL